MISERGMEESSLCWPPSGTPLIWDHGDDELRSPIVWLHGTNRPLRHLPELPPRHVNGAAMHVSQTLLVCSVLSVSLANG